MKFLYFLEGIRNGFLDFIFLTVTHIGEETVFLGKINPENEWRLNEDIIKTRFNFIKQ
jgi:hypothetical protein